MNHRKIKARKNKKKLLRDLAFSIKEVNLAKQGKINLKSFDDFLKEL